MRQRVVEQSTAFTQALLQMPGELRIYGQAVQPAAEIDGLAPLAMQLSTQLDLESDSPPPLQEMKTMVERLRRLGMLNGLALGVRERADSGLIAANQSQSSDPMTAERQIQLLGRKWDLQFQPQSVEETGAKDSFPLWIGGASVLATLLLALAVWNLGRQRARALLLARANHNALQQRNDRFKALFHQAAVGVVEIEPVTGLYMRANARFCRIVGYDSTQLIGLSLYDMVDPQDMLACTQRCAEMQQGLIANFHHEIRLICEDGNTIWAEFWVSPLLDQDGQPAGNHIAVVQDVTERRNLQQQLLAREAYSAEMMRYMPVGLVIVGPDGGIELANAYFEQLTGLLGSELLDETSLWRQLCPDPAQHQLLMQRLNAGRCQPLPSGCNMPAAEYVLRRKDGSDLVVEVSGRFLNARILLTFVDLSQRKQAEAEIRNLALYDLLTQLPNRRLLMERMAETIGRHEHSGAALLLLDIDNFKALNETLGHQQGDALLRLVATRLAANVGHQHSLARLGGDEFAVVLEGLPQNEVDAACVTEQQGQGILQCLRTPFQLKDHTLHITVSLGATLFQGGTETAEELLKRADLALYQAKNAGRDTLQFFDPNMQNVIRARVEMSKDLRLALKREEFELYYQPQVQTDKVVGAEALLRWRHLQHGFISPAQFVPVAEESGLILPLGQWVLEAACRQLALWARQPELAQLTMAVNVSPRQFLQAEFVTQVQQALASSGAQPQLLELELTEGMLLTDIQDTIDKMVQLKALGVRFSLDDFGTGYSSLSYLKRLPLDKLKIDQSFVREVPGSSHDATIAKTIVALGHSLGLRVIAEGVETEAQRSFLAEHGCAFWQGYLFSRPVPAAEFESWTLAYGAQSTPAEVCHV